MDTKLIECKLIDVPKVDGSVRTFSKEFAVKLSDSLKIDGQQSPIAVRPNPAAAGRYILISGRHRLYGMKNVLKEQFILCSVIDDMDETEAAMAADVENLWRTPLTGPQRIAALKRWMNHWQANLPAIEPRDKAPVSTPVGGAPVSADGGAFNPVTSTVANRTEARFNAAVAAVTGQGEAAVRRSKRLAKTFTEEQLEVFVQMDVNQTDMLTISNISDPGLRGEVVALIASGMDAQEAIKEVMKDDAPKRYNNHPEPVAAADKAEAKAAAKAQAPKLTDDQWFEESCGEKAAMFGDPTKFKADALLYRAVLDARTAFRVKAKKFVAAARKAGNYGAFSNIINRFISLSHPKDWLICPECKGKGTVLSPTGSGEDKKCPKCYGGGYLLKTEDYL